MTILLTEDSDRPPGGDQGWLALPPNSICSQHAHRLAELCVDVTGQ